MLNVNLEVAALVGLPLLLYDAMRAAGNEPVEHGVQETMVEEHDNE